MKKRILSFVLSLTVMVIAFAGCFDSDKPKKETNSGGSTQSKESAVSEPEEMTFAIGETAVFDDVKITATEFKESKGKEYFEPAEGKVFLGVKFTIENVSEEDVNISSLVQFSGYADDISLEYSISASMAFEDGSLDGTIAKGKKLIGWYSAEVPKDWKQLQIDFKPEIFSNTKASFIINK